MLYMLKLTENQHGRINLLNRPSLAKVKDSVMKQIIEAPKGTIFCLDMSQAGDINGSGADEIIGKTVRWLIENADAHDKYLYLTNLSPEEEFDHAYNITTALNIEKTCIVAKQGDSHLIIGYLGGAKASLREVLNIVYELKEVTARDIADRLGKQLNTTSTQLSTLYSLRLIQRTETQLPEGGRQFIYKSLF